MTKKTKVPIIILCILCVVYYLNIKIKNKSANYNVVSDVILKDWEKSNWIFLVAGNWYQPESKNISEYYPLTEKITPVLKLEGIIQSVSVTSDLKNYAVSYRTHSEKDHLWKSELISWNKPAQRKRIFSVTDKKEISIHGLSWSSNGQKLCFLLGELPEKPEVWLNQKLFVIDIKTGISREYGMIDCYGYTNYTRLLTPILGPYPIWSEDGQSIYYGSSNKEICKFDLNTGQCHSIGKGCIPIYEDNSRIVILSDNPCCLKEISFKSGQVRILSTFAGMRGFSRCFMSPDRNIIGINYVPEKAKPIVFFCLFWDIRKGIIGDLPQTIIGFGKQE